MEIEYTDYTINEFYKLTTEQQTELIYFAKNCKVFDKPFDHLGINTLEDKPLGLIIDLQNEFQNGCDLYTALVYILKLTEINNDEFTLLKLYQQRAWLVQQIDLITTNENETLVSSVTSNEVKAGIDDFEDIGVFMKIYNLCKGDVTKYDQVYNTPYNIAYAFLLADKKSIDYQRKLYSNN